MIFDPRAQGLFGGLFGVLIVASAIGYGLQLRYGSGSARGTIDNLNARIRAWWVMIALIAVAFLVGRTAVIVLFGLASFAALREFVTLTPTRRGDHVALALAFFVVLPLQYYLIAIDWYGFYAIFIPVYVFLLLPIVAALRGDTTNFIGRVAEVQWGLMITVYCVSHVPALLTLPIPGYDNRLFLIAFLVLVVQASDVLQYVWGSFWAGTRSRRNCRRRRRWRGFVGASPARPCLARRCGG